MISETKFSTAYTSFWKDLTPNSERFVRRINLNLERFELPISSVSSPERRAFINETAFRLFARIFPRQNVLAEKIETVKEELFDNVRTYLARFGEVDTVALSNPSVEEFEEILQICRSISKFVKQKSESTDAVIVAPQFKGCGIINACEADLLIGDHLIEVKAGDRSFRATDMRQLLTYCSLNAIANMYEISKVGCMNPRRGTYFLMDLDTLSLEMASMSSEELFANITYFISSGDISI